VVKIRGFTDFAAGLMCIHYRFVSYYLHIVYSYSNKWHGLKAAGRICEKKMIPSTKNCVWWCVFLFQRLNMEMFC